MTKAKGNNSTYLQSNFTDSSSYQEALLAYVIICYTKIQTIRNSIAANE